MNNKFKREILYTRKVLLTLPGVGDYVAGAVLSICFNKKEWIVDSNIVRMYKRYFGVKTSKEGRRDKHIIEISKIYVDCRNPRTANLAILDFSALVCTPRNPKCLNCILSHNCHFL